MTYHILRYDIWLCLLLSMALSYIPVKIAENIIPKKYEQYVQEHTVEDGQIGGKAGDNIVRANSIDDLLANEIFTIVSPGIQYRNKGAGYYGNTYMQAVTLPSGEKIAAKINEENVQRTGDSIYTGDSILPVRKNCIWRFNTKFYILKPNTI